MNSSIRTWAIGVSRFLFATLLAVVLLTGATLCAAHLAAWLRDEDAVHPRFLAIGAVCSLIFWLFIAILHLRSETQTIPFSQKKQFILKARMVLQEMGYLLVAQRANTWAFCPSFRSYNFGGAIEIDASEQEAKLTGPKISLDLFRRKFRLLKHAQRVHQYIDSERKFTETMLKRVELQLRLEPEQFDAVRANVIKVLQKEGIVICELNLLVQSDKGIHDNLIEVQIRDWLEQHQIDCDIRKDVIQFVEVRESQLESDKPER